jgi:hypothetical protein
MFVEAEMTAVGEPALMIVTLMVKVQELASVIVQV